MAATVTFVFCESSSVFSSKGIAVVHGDCRDVVSELGKYDFVFADPPFGIGHHYTGYDDQQYGDEFTREWVTVCWRACTGVMALHGPDDLAESYLAVARELGMRRIAWVNWHYRFGVCHRSNWIDGRCHCLIFAKSEPWTWNPDSVLVPSDRATKYADKRIHDSPRGGSRLPCTVWGIPSDGPRWGRVQGNNKEPPAAASEPAAHELSAASRACLHERG